MKVTGPTKDRARRLISLLEKEGKKRNEKIWADIAMRLGKPRRIRASINLWRLDRVAKADGIKGKVIAVPGKVLGEGEVSSALRVAAFEFSSRAGEKIKAAKGEAITLEALLEKKIKAGEIAIVK